MNANEAAKFIRDARKRLNMTQPQFASALGVTKRTIIYWEQGEYAPDTRTILAIKLMMRMAEEVT